MAERKTENTLERLLRKAGFEEDDFQFQGSGSAEIQRCLPSKRSGKAGKGKPEHIIPLNGDAADLLVTECKLDKAFHASANKLNGDSPLKPVEYAEDGVIHYMKGLLKEFNVIGLAVSGESDLVISTFKALRGGRIERLPYTNILKREDYLSALQAGDYGKKPEAEIKIFIKELHEFLRDEMDLAEAAKPLIVSGILLGLKDVPFERSYRDYTEKNSLAEALLQAIKNVLKKHGVKDDKFEAMISNYNFIKTDKAVKDHLKETIARIYRNLFSALRPSSNLDLLGNFYGEFLRYSGGDKKGLGIVLTPRHVTELFSDLADLDPRESVVLDICAGTGGFLISAMANMIKKAPNDSATISSIKSHRIIGIEKDKDMFALACSNMIFRGDGKANMFWDDCLTPDKDENTEEKIHRLKPNVAMLNPPYSKKDDKKTELKYVKRALDLIEPKGTCIAIVPVGCLIDDKKSALSLKKEIFASHTLKAVMSMPPQLFPTIGAVTAIVVFEAHKSHYNADGNPRTETWFSYWHIDGYKLLKNDRIEHPVGAWAGIKSVWLNDYFKRRAVPGKSFCKTVTHTEEWLAEAYMETDYSALKKSDFVREIKKFALHKLLAENPDEIG